MRLAAMPSDQTGCALAVQNPFLISQHDLNAFVSPGKSAPPEISRATKGHRDHSLQIGLSFEHA